MVIVGMQTGAMIAGTLIGQRRGVRRGIRGGIRRPSRCDRLLGERALADRRFARCAGAGAAVRAMGRLSAIRSLGLCFMGITGGMAARRFRVVFIRVAVIHVLVIGCKFGLARGTVLATIANILVALIASVIVGPIVRVMGRRLPEGRAIGSMAMGGSASASSDDERSEPSLDSRCAWCSRSPRGSASERRLRSFRCWRSCRCDWPASRAPS